MWEIVLASEDFKAVVTQRWSMKLVLDTVAARGSSNTQCLDPKHVGSVWGEVINVDRVFLQN